MNRQTRPPAPRFLRPVRVGVVALAVTLIAACSSGAGSGAAASKSAGASSGGSTGTDQKLAAMLPDALRQSGTLRVGTDPELRP
ncbi:MAG TPA: hypothetical protein VFH80_16395, partial [Solirubrobacteraceae bacterium]|nr:hypothetical protein [Solirubrobacteraceae bacterium]